MINEKINKSFLNILSPPSFIKNLAITQLLNVPRIIISNTCSCYKNFYKVKQTRKDKITEYKNYIIKHWNSILNMNSCDIKSSMESHISHCVAEHFDSWPKAYSKDRIETYLKLEEYKQNGINILDIVLKSLNKNEDYIYNEKEVSFAIFDKDTNLLPVRSTKNPISIVLDKIAHIS